MNFIFELGALLVVFLVLVGAVSFLTGGQAEPQQENQTSNLTTQKWLSDLALLAQLENRFQEANPYNASINYTCLPRARDFVNVVKKLGYDAYVDYGCNETPITENTSCHAWAVIKNEFLGKRALFPILPNKHTREAWEALK